MSGFFMFLSLTISPTPTAACATPRKLIKPQTHSLQLSRGKDLCKVVFPAKEIPSGDSGALNPAQGVIPFCTVTV